MQERYDSRKASFKDIDTNSLDRRRRTAKNESEESKREFLRALREAAIAETMQAPGNLEEMRIRKLFARTFMYHDTMISVPDHLSSQWYVGLRPEGQRCLALLQGNSLTLRQRNGQVVETFVLDPFSLKRTGDQLAMYDCVFGYNTRKMKKTIYIFDVLTQKGNDLICSDFAFRQYFLKEHWPFCDSQEGAPMLLGTEECPDFERIEFELATRDAVLSRYNQDDQSGTVSDSLLFYHREGKYTNGLSQEALVFRDHHLSRFAIDSKHDDGFDGGEFMEMVLRASLERPKKTGIVELSTWDGIVLHRMNLDESPTWLKTGVNKKPFILVRCQTNNQFEFIHFSSSGKPFPHSFNRIVDQFRKRKQALNLANTGNDLFDSVPLTIESLLSHSV